MKNTMKAWVLEKYNSPLVLKDVPLPPVGDDDVLVRVKAAGICGTDMKIYTGKLDGIIKLPHIPGHEGAGEIVETGKNVKRLKPGDRGIVYHYIPCRDCGLCRTGRENICFEIKRTGFELDGAFAEYIAIPAYNFCPVDDHKVLWAEMAVLPDAVLTPYHALKALGKVKSGVKVLVIGLGGLGLHAVLLGKMLGAEVAGADIRDKSLAEATRFGADVVFNPESQDPVSAIREWTEGFGADVVLDGVGTAVTFPWALKSLKKGGKLVLMGYDPLKPVPLDALGMHYNEWEIIGSRLGTKQELIELINYVKNGTLKPIVSSEMEMSSLNKVFDGSMLDSIYGRIVFKEL
ncbi:MAG: alcohol dehydrogenase catalytic domain-containing protein [Spirochaetia bacterium]|jgi:2-desacetyl-2-hydroxyethyl bacteriochlorophyllide A dehydrogenase|nr:alcohol dehydrogenase catalytic domain-containing protein [Spirochaetia bacterium]